MEATTTVIQGKKWDDSIHGIKSHKNIHLLGAAKLHTIAEDFSYL